MQAIRTQYFARANGAGRIKATCPGGSCYAAYDHGISSEQNHTIAAARMRHKMKWAPKLMVGGTLTDGSMVWVSVEGSPRI